MTDEEVGRYHDLVRKHGDLGMKLSFFNIGRYTNQRENPQARSTLLEVPGSVEEFRARVLRAVCIYHEFTPETFRELLDELRTVLAAAVQEFLDLFGENIFDYQRDRKEEAKAADQKNP